MSIFTCRFLGSNTFSVKAKVPAAVKSQVASTTELTV